jgi:hypothetical protein
MRRLLLLLLLALPLTAQDRDAVARLQWMTGHWSANSGGSDVEEIWIAPRAGLMLGMNRTVSKDRAQFEFIRIEATKDGVFYVAQPGGRPPTRFKLVESGASRVVFANPEHDFPKRILYELRDGKLCARVEGDGGQGEEWCWAKRP